MQVDVLCAQEHNLDTTQFLIRSVLYDTANKHWQRSKLVLGTTPITFKSSYNPGGTLITTVDSTTSRIMKQVRDRWGRWVLQELTGRGNRRLIVVSTYQPPVDKTAQPGWITVASQQVSLFTATKDPTTNPRTAFQRDLLIMLEEYKKQGYLIILMGNFNEPLGSDPDGITKVAADIGLIDIMKRRHSSTPPATYARGSTRLDYILTSPEV